jgi:hypothetical protein
VIKAAAGADSRGQVNLLEQARHPRGQFGIAGGWPGEPVSVLGEA